MNYPAQFKQKLEVMSSEEKLRDMKGGEFGLYLGLG